MRFARTAVTALVATSALGVAATAPAGAVTTADDSVFISELHYDNASGDVGEAVEVFGPANTDLAGWSIALYNGSPTQLNVYATIWLTGTVPDEVGGAGALAFDAIGLQNGAPDGLALVDDAGVVRQFLSYEGSFTAVSGPAAGMISTDIGVSESGTGPIGDSLQLSGTGCTYAAMTWNESAPSTFGSVGAIVPTDCPTVEAPDPLPTVRFSELHYDNSSTDIGEAIEVFGPAGTDLTGWSVVLYNGSNDLVYDSDPLPSPIPDLDGTGTGVVVVSYPPNGIQNGSPDGLALVDATGAVVEFLSYEGTMTAVDGPAAGLTSTDIGIAEGSSTPAGQSLQRDDAGAWYGPQCNSFGALNSAECPPQEVKIHEIQGSSDTPNLLGERVIIEGVVVGDHEGTSPALRGFFVQEEDLDADADPTTSEGIFVFNFNNDDVSVGDVVRVEGTVDERFGNTQLTDFVEVEVLDVEPRIATPATVMFPLESVDALEAVEGMVATFDQTLVISEYFNYDRFGEVVVALPAADLPADRPMIPTAVHGPDTQEALDLADLNERSRITVDDGITAQNPAAPIHPINRQPFTADNSFRGGDQVSGLTGPVFYDFSLYRVLPYESGGYDSFVRTTAPETPDDVGGSLNIASLNTLNYFLTLDDGQNDICGANQTLECRGADDADEFERQRVKLLNTLEDLDADVIGLMEVENTPGVEPLADIVDGLNDRLGAGTYDYVDAGDDSVVGTDAIKVGIIYRTSAVSPVGDTAVLDDPDFLNPFGYVIEDDTDPRFGEPDYKNRAAVAASFVDRSTGGVVSVVVNHLKSKGSGCGAPDDHPLAGSCDATRTAAAEYLVDWFGTDPTDIGDSDWMILGDLNSYDKEAPVTTLTEAGFSDLVGEYGGEYAYSYVFDGEFGYLDYVMSSASLTDQVTGATEWHVNSDEPDVFDYDTSFKSAAQIAVFDPTSPFRSSDHDPALAGLDLATDAEIVIEWVDGEVADLLEAGSLNDGQASSLARKLDQALTKIESGQINGALGVLNGVSEQLQDFVDDGILTADEAEGLIAAIEAIRSGLS